MVVYGKFDVTMSLVTNDKIVDGISGQQTYDVLLRDLQNDGGSVQSDPFHSLSVIYGRPLLPSLRVGQVRGS